MVNDRWAMINHVATARRRIPCARGPGSWRCALRRGSHAIGHPSSPPRRSPGSTCFDSSSAMYAVAAIQVARRTNDFRAAAAVIRDVAQCSDVDAVGSGAGPRRTVRGERSAGGAGGGIITGGRSAAAAMGVAACLHRQEGERAGAAAAPASATAMDGGAASHQLRGARPKGVEASSQSRSARRCRSRRSGFRFRESARARLGWPSGCSYR